MKFTAELISDNRVTVPVEIVRRGKLKKGDLVEVDVKKVEEPKKE